LADDSLQRTLQQESLLDLSPYLTRRGLNGKWQLRVPVPRPLHGKFLHPNTGRLCKELTKALDTTDRALAVKRGRPIVVHWEDLFERCRAGVSQSTSTQPTIIELEEAAVAVGHDLPLEDMAAGRKTLRQAGSSLWDANVRYYDALRAQRARHAATGNVQAVEEMADEAIEALGWDIPKQGDLYGQFCDLIAKANLAALNLASRHNAGEIEAETESKLVLRVRSRQAGEASTGERLMDLYEQYAKQRRAEGRKSSDGVEQDRKKLHQFAQFIGEARRPDTIERTDILRYRTILDAIPRKWRETNAYKGLTITQAAEKARAAGTVTISKETINTHLSAISGLYKWLVRVGKVERNPVTGLFYDLPKGKNPRPPFSVDQLNTILRSPLFTGFLADGREHLPGDRRSDDWRNWTPLIALFTGARIGEIAQLRIGDIRREHEHWIIYVAHDEKAGLTTKSKLSRPMAVHPKLRELGLLAFHGRQAERAGHNVAARLFDGLQPDHRGYIGARPSDFWRDYLARIKVKAGADGLGTHSFRHTMADELRRADYLDDQVAIALGHSFKTVTAGYGRLSQGTVRMQAEMMERAKFDGVDFGHLIPLSVQPRA
jgi:integrase